MKPSLICVAKTHIVFAGVLILALLVAMLQATEAKPKKVTVVDCGSESWWSAGGVSTPEMRHCEDQIAFDHQTHPNDPQTWHYLQCFSNGTAQCCTGSGTCTSVRRVTKIPPAGLLEGEAVSDPRAPAPTGGGRGTPSRGGGKLY